MTKRYRITAMEMREVVYIVEAENKTEAEDKVADRDATEIDWQQSDFVSIESVECISKVEYEYDMKASNYGYNWRTFSSTN